MLPEKHPLIDSITRPLDDNAELKLSASQILREKFDPDHPSVPEMLERLEKKDMRVFAVLGKIALWSLAVIVLTVAISSDVRTFLRVAQIHDWEALEDIDIPHAKRKLTQQERLLLGDRDSSPLEDRKKLFDGDPTNPAYFAEYVSWYIFENESLPPDYFETAERIDPGNSFFIYWAAAAIGSDSIETKSFTGPKPPDRIVDGVRLRHLPREGEYTIKDQAAYERALDLLKKASEMPEFRSYTNQMIKGRARFIPTDGFLNYRDGLNYIGGSSGISSLFAVCKLISARAEELSKNGNSEEYRLLAVQLESFLTKIANNEDIDIANTTAYEVIAHVSVVGFHAAAERLELKDFEETYRKQKEAFGAYSDFIELRKRKGIDTFPQDRASPLGYYPSPYSTHFTAIVPVLHDSYLKPMRLVEHELLGRFGVLAVSLVLLIGAFFVFLLRFLAPTAIRLPSMRIAGLLKFSDWIWIFILGIALPILVFLFISRLSPVSGRDYSCSHFEFAFPGVHLIALLLTLLLAPAIVTRWRLTRHAAAFKFGSRLDLLSLPVIVVMLVYAIIAYPVLTYFRLNDLVEFAFMLPPLGWLAFVFFNGLRIFLGSARTRLIQTSTAIAVLPAYAMAILALCLTLPIYISAERQGLKAGKNIFIDPVTSELGAYEFKVAAQKRKEINAILGIE